MKGPAVTRGHLSPSSILPAEPVGEGISIAASLSECGCAVALAATGLDLSTLQNYAYVSRSIPYSVRSERLSWEHHLLLAKLPDADMQGWIKACEAEEDAGRRVSTRRLRKSLVLGRVATVAGASSMRMAVNGKFEVYFKIFSRGLVSG